MVVVARVNSTKSDGVPSPTPVIATTLTEYDPASNPTITSLLSLALTMDEMSITLDDDLITCTL